MGKRYDAKEVSDFITLLGDDIDDYRESARLLENEYGNYYNNDTHRGLAAEASKDFIDKAQMEKFHIPNRELQTLLFSKCLDVENNFKSMVDTSSEARIDTDVLKVIDDNFCKWGDGVHASGSVIEQLTQEVIDKFSDYGEFNTVSYDEARIAYAYLCGPDGHLVDCIKRMYKFDEESLSALNSCSIKDHAYDLQNMMQKTANALSMMQAYMPNLSKTSLSIVSMWSAAASGNTLNIKTFATEEEAANYLDQQFKILCDDNNTNDAKAIENINACLMGYLCIETDGKDRYVAYDHDKIRETLKYLDKDGLAYDLFASVHNQINEKEHKGVAIPTAIKKLGLGGKLENAYLQVKKDGAGVRLEVTANTDFLPGKEINHKPVAYAANEYSATNYFTTDGKYDWDAIEEWYKAKDDFNDDYHHKSIEYDVLAFEINNMSDEEVSQLINSAVYWKDPACLANVVSDKLDILSDRYMLQMQGLRVMGPDGQKEILGYTGKDFENKYTRAVLIRNVNNRLQALPPTDTYYVEINSEKSKFAQEDGFKDTYGDKDYTASIQCITSPLFPNPVEAAEGGQAITVHPYSGYAEIQGNINEEVCVTINGMTTNVSSDAKKYVFDQAIGYLTGKIGGPTSFTYSMSNEMISLANAYESEAKAQGVNEALNQASAAQSMMIEGTTVHVSGAGVESIYVYENAYDDKQLVINVAAYNEQHDTHYTIEQMKREYVSNSDVFNQYNTWYTRYGLKETNDLKIELGEEYGQEKYDAMSAEELEAALKEKGLF